LGPLDRLSLGSLKALRNSSPHFILGVIPFWRLTVEENPSHFQRGWSSSLYAGRRLSSKGFRVLSFTSSGFHHGGTFLFFSLSKRTPHIGTPSSGAFPQGALNCSPFSLSRPERVGGVPPKRVRSRIPTLPLTSDVLFLQGVSLG